MGPKIVSLTDLEASTCPTEPSHWPGLWVVPVAAVSTQSSSRCPFICLRVEGFLQPHPPTHSQLLHPLLPTLHLNSILLSDNLGKPLVFNCCWNPPEGMVCRSLGVAVALLSCGGDRHISACSLLPSQSREYPSTEAMVGFSYIFPSCIPGPIHNILHSSLWVFTGHRRRPHLSWKTKQRHKNLCLCSQSGF